MKWKTKKNKAAAPQPVVVEPPVEEPTSDAFESLKATVKKYKMELIKEYDEYDGTVRLRVRTKGSSYDYPKNVTYTGWTIEERLAREYGPLEVKVHKWAREHGLTKRSERIAL